MAGVDFSSRPGRISISKFIAAWSIKLFLTGGQLLRLLCVGGRCNLLTVRSIQLMENAHDH